MGTAILVAGLMLTAGQELGTELLCTSDRVATAGHHLNKSLGYDEVVEAYREKAPTTWRISLGDSVATVATSAGATGEELGPEPFLIQRHPAKPSFLLLMSMVDTSTQIITISRTDSTFVYSSQSLNILFNRTATFVGKCVDAR